MTYCENYVAVFRHGQFDGPGAKSPSYRNFVDSLAEPSWIYPLTDKGKSQIEMSVRQLLNYQQINLIFTSQFLRTQQSAEIIARLVKEKTGNGVEIVASSLLNSIWMPPESLSESEYIRLHESGDKNAVANWMFSKWAEGLIGETPELVKKRIEILIPYLRNIVDVNSPMKVAVVTHASFSSALQRYVKCMSLTEPRDEGQILNVGRYYLLRVDNSQKRRELDLITYEQNYLVFQETERRSLAVI